MPDGQGLALRTGYFHLDWTLRFTHPTVVIDGNPNECDWGEQFFPLESGPHEIETFYRYLGGQAGKACTRIDVAPNGIVRASYRAPNSVVIAFLPGKMTVETAH